jgi:hypothetical protein
MFRVLRINAGQSVFRVMTVLSLRTGQRMVVPYWRSRAKAVSTSCSTHWLASPLPLRPLDAPTFLEHLLEDATGLAEVIAAAAYAS